jgi:hypothetical protein
MNAEQLGLYERIKAFRFDEGEAAFPFVSRLAWDNGWSSAYAARVIKEYRRFVFLALVAGHPVSPSDQVDQAWHLHLLYTRSYWGRFCTQTLGRPLHHEPTKGGRDEKGKFCAWYAATIESYCRYFGEEPPRDIWRDADTRFGQEIHFERVNRSTNWVVSKVWGKTTAVLVALALGWIFLSVR